MKAIRGVLFMTAFILLSAATVKGSSVDIDKTELKQVYDQYCDSSWAKLSNDGGSLSLDTNPNNIDDHVEYGALLAIKLVNSALGLPDSLYDKMTTTRALDGRQSAKYGNVEVSWSYHPDQGMEIVYELETEGSEITKDQLKSVYDSYCESGWAKLSSDGGSLSLDTNPNNVEDHVEYGALLAIKLVNSALGLPDSLYDKMTTTRALDGRQSARYGNVNISWSYHPDQGMEIIYDID